MKYIQDLHFYKVYFLSNPKIYPHTLIKIKIKLKNLQKITNNNEFLANYLLSFVITKNFIDKVIIGVNNSNQLLKNIKKNFKIDEFININYEEIPENILIPSLWPKN